MSIKDLLQTKTIIGAIITTIGFLAQENVLAALHLPATLGAYLVALGGVITAIGLRDAIGGGMTIKEWLTSKSVIGVVGLALGYLVDSGAVSLFGPKIANILIVVSGLLAAIGFRSAVAKAQE